jgi:ferredoxin/coenzyme F420-reducing hydrogenase delta subunit
MLFPLGITGYWLVWDELAQFVALGSAEFIDWLPFFTDYMARNFLTQEGLSDRFFTLMAFIHLVGLPIFFVFGIWIHVFRLNKPRINPPRTLMIGTTVAFFALSIIYPAVSHPRANLDHVPQSVGLDWFYLPVYPLIESGSPGWAWFLLVAITALLIAAPWIPRSKADPVAIVNLDYCNGCARCVADCPFGAVQMELRSDGKPYEFEAVVDAGLCVSCGLCVGACPTATAFRTRTVLSPGIDLPEIPAATLRDDLQSVAASLEQTEQVMVIACQTSPTLARMRETGQAALEVKCLGQLPPSFLDYILSRTGARGILLAGCEGGDCKYRYGIRWTEDRVTRKRDPMLRSRIDTQQITHHWDAQWAGKTTPEILQEFRRQLDAMKQATGAGP